MFVSPGAREKILNKRRAAFSEGRLRELLIEAGRLGITKDEMIKMIEESDL